MHEKKQIGCYMDPTLHAEVEAKISHLNNKNKEDKITLSEVIRGLLERWVDGRIKIRKSI